MSAQFISRDEFDAGQDRLFMHLTAFLASQNDLAKIQAREDKRELLERIQADKAEILAAIRNLSKQMSNLEASQ